MSRKFTGLIVLFVSIAILALFGRIAYAFDVLSDEFQLSPPASPDAERYKPAVAYNSNHGEYLVVWHNTWPSGHRDIYARRVSEDGTILSWFAVSAGTNSRFLPSVAYNVTNDEYLVVWMYEASPNVYEIWGRIVSWNGSSMDPAFRIIQWPNRSFWSPKVAWNSYRNEYFVVWNAFDTSGGFPGVPNDIAGYRISSSGSVIPGLPLSLTTYSAPHQVDMVYNDFLDEYFLVYVVVHSQASTGNDIYGLRVRWDGQVVSPGLIHIDDSTKNQNAPAVATNGFDRYMVVWQHEYSATDNDIHAREYSATGSPVAGKFVIRNSPQDETSPDIAANGAKNEWLTVWQKEMTGGSGYAIEGWRRLGALSTFVDIASWVFWENEKPAVAADIPGYLVVYEGDDSVTHRHIYGRLIHFEAEAIGVFRNSDWYLDKNGSGFWDGCGTDYCANFGTATDTPIAGDWKGNERKTIGVKRGNKWYLDYVWSYHWDGCGTDRCYTFGVSTDMPVIGDWNNSGTDKIGVFRNSKWYLDKNGNGFWDGCGTDYCANFGTATDTPVTGDWDGDGYTEIGVKRGNKWYLDYNGNRYWDGCSVDRCYTFGQPTDIPVIGDWNGDEYASIGVKRGNKWYLDYNENGTWNNCTTDRCYAFGLSTDKPVVGNW